MQLALPVRSGLEGRAESNSRQSLRLTSGEHPRPVYRRQHVHLTQSDGCRRRRGGKQGRKRRPRWKSSTKQIETGRRGEGTEERTEHRDGARRVRQHSPTCSASRPKSKGEREDVDKGLKLDCCTRFAPSCDAKRRVKPTRNVHPSLPEAAPAKDHVVLVSGSKKDKCVPLPSGRVSRLSLARPAFAPPPQLPSAWPASTLNPPPKPLRPEGRPESCSIGQGAA